MDNETQYKAGYVTLVGKPNVGKSTMLNALLEQKIAIVSPLPQTTRHQFAGILSTDAFQIIFLDTPGLLNPKYQLHQYMLKMALKGLESADVVLYLTDSKTNPSYLFEDIPSTVKHVLKQKKKFAHILIINKVDLVDKRTLLPMIDFYDKSGMFDEIIPVSALKGSGLDRVIKALSSYLPEGVPFYPEDQIADVSERFVCAELVREQIFLNTRDEIPYASTVMIDQFKDRGKKLYISANIYVMRPSQKAVIIGKNGLLIRKIGKAAREEIEEFLGRDVYLELWVKVRDKWRAKPDDLRFFGYT